MRRSITLLAVCAALLSCAFSGVAMGQARPAVADCTRQQQTNCQRGTEAFPLVVQQADPHLSMEQSEHSARELSIDENLERATWLLVAVGAAQFLVFLLHARLFAMTDETARLTQRARISQFDVREVPWGGVDTDGVAVAEHAFIVWKNTGSTPALNVKLYKHGWRGPIDTELNAITFTKAGFDPSNVTVGAGRTIETSPYAITVQDMEETLARKKLVLMWSRVEYSEIFHKKVVRAEEVVLALEVLAKEIKSDGTRYECRFILVSGKSENE